MSVINPNGFWPLIKAVKYLIIEQQKNIANPTAANGTLALDYSGDGKFDKLDESFVLRQVDLTPPGPAQDKFLKQLNLVRSVRGGGNLFESKRDQEQEQIAITLFDYNGDKALNKEDLLFKQAEVQQTGSAKAKAEVELLKAMGFDETSNQPEITLAISPTAGVVEDGTSNLIYTFSRTGATTTALTVNYTVAGSATLGTDYTGIAATPAVKTVTFAANSSTATVTVDPTADTTIEADETVELTLATGAGYTIGTTAAVVGTILNDDKPDNNLPEITVAVGPIIEVLEDGSEALLFTFTRKGSTVSPLGVNYALAGTATPGVDYTGINTSSTTQTLSFASGTDSATLRLIPTADPWIEPDETVSLTLLPGTDYTVGTTTAVSGTIRNDDVARLSYTTSDAGDNSFTLSASAGGKARLKISLADAELNAPYDLALFTVDDLQGRIDGLNPSDPAYSRVALSRAKNVFSAISNLPQGFNPLTGSRVLELNSGDHFRFMLLEKGTLDIANQRGVISDFLISSIRNVAIDQISPDQYILSWNDSAGNGKTRNLRVKIQATDDTKALGANLQDNKQGEMLDLRGVDPTKQVRASFVVNREAGYNNVVGFYKIIDLVGSIIDPVTGANLKPGDPGYTQTALRYRVAGMDLQVANQSTASGSSLMQAGSIFAPFIVANGSPEQLLDSNPSNDVPVYFPFLAANSDGIDHIRLLADNTFGFEDLLGGGDLDYNDMIIAVGLAVV
jgi:hypothetical protein